MNSIHLHWPEKLHLHRVIIFIHTLETLWHVAFVLQGRHATQDEVTACAYQAVNLDNKYNGAPTQVRVVMGKEPRHFLAIFKGRLVIFEVIIPSFLWNIHIALDCKLFHDLNYLAHILPWDLLKWIYFCFLWVFYEFNFSNN